LDEVAEHLRGGGLVAIPTETVYGLAANALDPDACRRIFEVKGRPLIDPLIVHVRGVEAARELAEFGPEAERLMSLFWPGPLTLVMRRRSPPVQDIVTAGLPTVAIRSPRHPLARELLARAGIPIAAPSANRFGYVSPTCAEHVVDGLGGSLDYVLDGGPCEIGLESTILGIADPANPVLLRPGAISRETLAEVLGRPVSVPRKNDAPIEAPGMLRRHYSPVTPLELFEKELPSEALAPGEGRRAVVHFSRPASPVGGADQYWFTESGDVAEAARNVFSLLRRLDAAGYGKVWVQKAPSNGVGEAINDRLSRAAAR
jgi:L-threonylcarbamoyladenylate synthase